MSKEKLSEFLEERVYLPDRALSSFYSPQGGIIAKILELPWKENARGISCIPEGLYTVTWSGPVLKDDPNTLIDESGGRIERPYDHFIIHDVPNRSGILIHAGVKPEHSRGCQLAGSRFIGVNSPTPELADSRVKLAWMTANLPKKFKLRILAKSGTPYK